MKDFINKHPFVVLASVLVIAETTFRIVKLNKKAEVKKAKTPAVNTEENKEG